MFSLRTARQCSSQISKQTPRRLQIERLERRNLLTSFDFSGFGSAAGLNLVGSASITANHELLLTPATQPIEGVPPHEWVGGAWYVAEKSRVAGGFDTTFRFRSGSSGFAFHVQNSNPFELRDRGGGLGYAGGVYSGAIPDGIRNSVAIEFDNVQQLSTGDPSYNHISVHTNGSGPNSAHEDYSIGRVSTSSFDLANGQVHTARISYTPGTLRIFLDDLGNPILTVPFDLPASLHLDQGRAWLGFTASGGTLDQHILNWNAQFVDDLVIADKPSAIEGTEITTSEVTFTVHRFGDLTAPLAVSWSTADGTAIGSSDFTANSGQLTFAPGESQHSVVVQVNSDSTPENHETFRLLLSTSNAAIAAFAGEATILNDDTLASISAASAIEGRQQFVSLGAFVDLNDNGGMTFSAGMAWGPDGNLYVASNATHEILKFDGTAGTYLGDFVSAGQGVEYPAVEGLVWHNDQLYVLCRDSAQVLKFDINGNALGEFIAPRSGGLQFAKGMSRGPDGTWFISSANAVLRYAADGAPMGALSVPAGVLNTPRGLRFGPDGNLYVASENNGSVIRFQVANGEVSYDRVFVSSGDGGLLKPGGLLFVNGSLLVADRDNNAVLSYDVATGSFQGAAVPAGQGGLSSPHGLLLDPHGNLLVGGRQEILRYGPGSQAAFTVQLHHPSGTSATVAYSTADLAPSSALAGSDYQSIVAGSITFRPGETTKTILVQTMDDAVNETTESFAVSLTSSVGATIERGRAVGYILDNDPFTKFYVVDDAASDRTYEYGETFGATANYSLAAGNAAPRGAASSVEGIKIWVVDASKKVYVYDSDGAPLGSWTAGSMPSKAVVEGITTNGTDVWIVDASSDKVYKFTGAAGLTSGSSNSSSNFSLNSANKNPKDIVTDGTYLYVINDTNSSDKVFKYTLTGSLVGSWALATSEARSPTGITLDPSHPSHLWIVDNGADRVYQYDNAVTRTSGSLSASTWFALAAGNTNPQGIADPPPAGSHASLPVSEPATAVLPAMPFARAVPIDFLATAPASADRWGASDTSARHALQPHLVDQLMNAWRSVRKRAGNLAHTASRIAATSQIASGQPARCELLGEARDREQVDSLMESTLDLLFPDLLADGRHGIGGWSTR